MFFKYQNSIVILGINRDRIETICTNKQQHKHHEKTHNINRSGLLISSSYPTRLYISRRCWCERQRRPWHNFPHILPIPIYPSRIFMYVHHLSIYQSISMRGVSWPPTIVAEASSDPPLLKCVYATYRWIPNWTTQLFFCYRSNSRTSIKSESK